MRDNPGRHLSRARAAAELLTTNWFPADAPRVWIPGDFWKAPTIILELTILGTLTRDKQYAEWVENARDKARDWYDRCGYLDDLTVWAMMLNGAYDYYTATGAGDTAPLVDDLKFIYGDLDSTWDDVCGGGIYWARPGTTSGPNKKATNSTLGFVNLTLDLYRITKDDAYLEHAHKIWSWIAGHGLILDDGRVWGGLTEPRDGCVHDPENKPVVALQGNPLEPLWKFYAATGETSYLDTAQKIVEATLREFTWPKTRVLLTKYDADWSKRTFDQKWEVLDFTMFKGIFCGFAGTFVARLATVDDPERKKKAKEYGDALQENSDQLVKTYPEGVYDMNWIEASGPDDEGDPDPFRKSQMRSALQFGAMAAFAAAARSV